MVASPKVVVIGIGNAFRRDDSAGLAVSRAVEQKRLTDVHVVHGIGEGTQMIDAWDGARAVFLVDCAVSGRHPGEIIRYDGLTEPIPENLFRNHSTHCFSVVTTIGLAGVLGRLPQNLVVYGIEGADFGFGEGTSYEVATAVEEVTRRIMDEIQETTANETVRR